MVGGVVEVEGGEDGPVEGGGVAVPGYGGNVGAGGVEDGLGVGGDVWDGFC